ncbi:hypothetical protein MNB_SV-13-1086 [hydrothermal vent metagenome]|uniref:Uncharacterized protein n=1 Tax=hydrothermal vent metagenome TaxID=652676 RepID=A0A1W1D109_9ZZZZ
MIFIESDAEFNFQIEAFDYDNQDKVDKKFKSFYPKISQCTSAIDFIAKNSHNIYFIEVKDKRKIPSDREDWNEMFKELCKNIIDTYGVIHLVDSLEIQKIMDNSKFDEFQSIIQDIKSLDKKFILFITGDLERDELLLINEILLKKLKKSLKLFSIDVIVETVYQHNKNIYKVINATP